MLLQLVVLALIIYLLWFYGVHVRKYPKGPTPLPLIGNILQLPSKDVHVYYDQLAETYGPVYTLFLPEPSVVLTRYEDIRECMINRGEHFTTTGPEFGLLNSIPNGGIIASNGDNWREQRRLALHILRDFGFGKAAMEQQIMSQAEQLLLCLQSAEDTKRADFFTPLQLCIGNVVNRLLVGYAFKPEDSERLLAFVEIISNFFLKAMGPEMALFHSLPWAKHVPILNRPYKRTEEDLKQYRAFIRAEVDAQLREFDTRAPAPVTNFVHAYLLEMQTSKNPFLTIEQLYCVVSDLWVAGMETTSIFLKWALIYVMRFPDAQRNAVEEIERVVGRDRYVSSQDRPLMPYMTALICEIGRYSVFASTLFRLCPTEQTLAGQHVPAHTSYLLNYYSTNSRIGVEDERDAAAFRPERFLEADGKTLKKEALSRYNLFGLGRRQCLGEGLAKLELFLILTTLLQKFTFCPPDRADGSEGTVEDVDVTYIYGVIMYPKQQPCKLVARY